MKVILKTSAVFLAAISISHLASAKNIYGSAYGDSLVGTAYQDTIVAYAGDDNVNGMNGNDLIYGGKGNDTLDGDAGVDILRGDRGNDKLYGGSGSDRLYGGKDHDNLYGEYGNDNLWGNQGNDYLSGGNGNDTYYYHYGDGYDVIFQDTGGTDKIVITGVGHTAVSVLVNGADKIISVPNGQIRIKNYQSNVIESIVANDVEVGGSNFSPAPVIQSIQYATLPLVVGSNESVQVRLDETSFARQERNYYLEVEVIRSSGTWKVASGALKIEAGKTSVTGSFNLTFNTAGWVQTKVKVYSADKSRLLVSRQGYGSDEVKASAGIGNVISNFPYFWQLANSYNPYGSFQNTSVAMVLKYYGANITPDAISSYWGTSYAQTLDGLRTVFNSEAAYRGLNIRLKSTPYGTLSRVNSNLAVGKPVIVHGYTTSYGHVLVLVGYDGTYYTAHDPYGEWNEVPYSSGYYRTATAGRYVKYHKDAFREAFAPDGYIWMHEVQ